MKEQGNIPDAWGKLEPLVRGQHTCWGNYKERI